LIFSCVVLCGLFCSIIFGLNIPVVYKQQSKTREGTVNKKNSMSKVTGPG
jgi:hypothetical protein